MNEEPLCMRATALFQGLAPYHEHNKVTCPTKLGGMEVVLAMWEVNVLGLGKLVSGFKCLVNQWRFFVVIFKLKTCDEIKWYKMAHLVFTFIMGEFILMCFMVFVWPLSLVVGSTIPHIILHNLTTVCGCAHNVINFFKRIGYIPWLIDVMKKYGSLR